MSRPTFCFARSAGFRRSWGMGLRSLGRLAISETSFNTKRSAVSTLGLGSCARRPSVKLNAAAKREYLGCIVHGFKRFSCTEMPARLGCGLATSLAALPAQVLGYHLSRFSSPAPLCFAKGNTLCAAKVRMASIFRGEPWPKTTAYVFLYNSNSD